MIVIKIFPGITQNFEYKITDLKFKVRKLFNYEPSLNSSVAVVQIDDESKKESGLDIWPYGHYATILEKIPESNTIGSDIMFTLSVDTKGWEGIIDAMMMGGNIISPYIVSVGHESLDKDKYGAILDHAIDWPSVEPGTIPHISDIPYKTGGVNPDLLIFSSSIGFVNINPDSDGVLRKIPIVYELDGKIAPHMLLQVISEQADWDLKKMELKGSYELTLNDFPVDGVLKNISIPLDGDGNMIINYISADKVNNQVEKGEFNLLSAWKIFKSEVPIPLENKAVIFGDHSFAAKDFSTTSIGGVQHNPIIYAMVMSNILNESFISPISNISEILLTILMTSILLVLVRHANVLWVGLGSIITMVSYQIISFLLFVFSGIEIPVLNILLPFIVSLSYTLIFLIYKAQINIGVLEGSLRSYLSPVLMEKIKNDPDMLKLGGERKRISVMFSDIAGFTSFTDEADPAEVQLVLDDYFAEMAKVVFDNGGIIDKYMGDGILAFFENPENAVTSPQASIKTAVAMQKKALALDKKYREQKRFPFAIRVAITTGYAKVGNIGPKEKIDYTIIGSVVNLCSRLEGLGENGDVVFDEDTYHFIKDDYSTQSIGEHPLKGFEKPVKVFKLSSD